MTVRIFRGGGSAGDRDEGFVGGLPRHGRDIRAARKRQLCPGRVDWRE